MIFILLLFIIGNSVCFRGLDNKCSIFKLSFDDDGATKKQTVAMHTSYMACCGFTSSDQQVQFKFNHTSL